MRYSERAKTNILPTSLRAERAVFALIVGLFVAARLWRLAAYDLWADELTTFLTVQFDWRYLAGYAMQEIVHPPLFYAPIKLWAALGGESLLWLKLFPALASLAGIVPLVLLCRELRLAAAEINLAVLLSAVNGYLIYYSQELRPYSFLLLLTICSLWLYARYLNAADARRGLLLALAAANLLLVYTHFFGWLVVGLEALFTLIWRRQRSARFLLSVAALALAYAPWMYILARRAAEKGGFEQNLGWIQAPTLRDLVWFYVTLNGPFRAPWVAATSLVGLLLFGAPVLAWARRDLARGPAQSPDSQATTLWFLLLFALLPTLAVFLASQLLPQAIWHPRYLIVVVALYLILVAVAVNRLRPHRLRAAALALVVAWAALSGWSEINDTDRIAWHTAVAQMSQAEPASSQRVDLYTFGSQDIQFYLESAGERRFRVVPVEDRESPALAGDHFWVAFRVFGDRYRLAFADTIGNVQEEQLQLARLRSRLASGGYRVGEGVEAGTPGYRVFLFPVWRSAGAFN